MNDKLLFLDVETTGLEEEDRLCQIAWQPSDGIIGDEYFKPAVPIKTGAMAVSHITNKMVEDKEPFAGSTTEALIKNYADQDYIFVAHNAPFDLKMLKKEGIEFKRAIDTKKLSHALDADETMESHRMQYLRYHYEIELPDAVAHTAEGDVAVLKAVYEKLVEEMNNPSLEEQIAISERPILFKKIKFGKYAGNDLASVALTNPGYLEWLLGQKKESHKVQDETDWIYTLEHYLRNV